MKTALHTDDRPCPRANALARPIVLALFAATVALGAGCNREVGTLTIILLRQTEFPNQDPFDPPDTIVRIHLRVEADDIGWIDGDVYEPGGATSSLGAIPVGDRRIITVEGFGPTGPALLRGRSLPLTIGAGDNLIQIFVARLDAFTVTMDPLADKRFGHTATVLPNGTVLLAGGATEPVGLPSEPLPGLVDARAGAEIFHPTSASLVRLITMSPRAFHGAALFGGDLLLSGGIGNGGWGEIDLLDIVGGGTMPPMSSCAGFRAHHAVVTLDDDTILIAGGNAPGGEVLDAAEILSAEAACPEASMSSPRSGLQLTPLLDGTGRILVTGGLSDSAGTLVAEAEVFDPATNTFVSMGSLEEPRAFHTATALPGGYVVLVGGVALGLTGELEATDAIEVFVPGEGFRRLSFSSTAPRWRHTATYLPDSFQILVAGGWNSMLDRVPVPRAESIDLRFFAAGDSDLGLDVDLGPFLSVPRAGHTATLLGNGMVLLAGGAGLTGEVTYDAEVYNPR